MAEGTVSIKPRILKSDTQVTFTGSNYYHIDIFLPNNAMPNVNYYPVPVASIGSTLATILKPLTIYANTGASTTNSPGSWIRLILSENFSSEHKLTVNIYWIPVE